jgi:type IV secretion system protein TrbL
MAAGVARGSAALAGGSTAAYRAGGATGVATTGLARGAEAVMSPLRRAASSLKDSFEAAGRATAGEGSPAGGDAAASSAASSAGNPPAWARRLKRTQTINHGTSAAAHAVRSGDHGGGGASVDLSQRE